MDLLTLAVPFFIMLIFVELIVDRARGTRFYRLQDAVASMSTGVMSQTTQLFTKVISILAYGWVLENLAPWQLDESLFNASLAGLGWWLLALLMWDFFYYWKHRLGHEISIFWAAHSVHHQSEDYNLSTALRQTSSDFLISWVVFLPMLLVGMPVDVVAIVAAVDLIYQFGVHTQHIGKLGWFDRVFVSPSNHRVHHAQNAIYIDKNYGGILVLWDRLFDTFQEELDSDPVIFGVRKPLQTWNPVSANLQVYKYLWFDAKRASRWRDKLSIWFRRTGWRPADVAERWPAPARELTDFRKYEIEISRTTAGYILAQFIVAVALSGLAAPLALTLDATQLLVFCLHIWWVLSNIGSLNNGARFARHSEVARLLCLPLVAIWLMSSVGVHATSIAWNLALMVITFYLLISLVALWKAPLPVTGKLIKQAV